MPNKLRNDLHIVDEHSFPYIYEQNATIKLRSNDGLVRCNVYRPKSKDRVPSLVTYGPYGKDIPYEDFNPKSFSEINPKHQSEHSAFETPDPNFWTSHGYAVVRADECGCGQSPGVLDTMSKSTSEAFCEVIEWAAEQPWSSGKVGLVGISYFAGTQWRAAARQPKGLACIIPTEGMSDYYRDRCRHGGILTGNFLKWWYERQVLSNQYGLAGKRSRKWGPDTIEGDLPTFELAERRRDQPSDNAANLYRDAEYYASKEYNLEDIAVPLLSVGNWGSIMVHLRGNILAFMHAGSQLKFLRMVVGRHDLPFYYDEEVEVQKSFLDAFLKDQDSRGWKTGKVPPVDLILRRSGIPYNDPAAEKTFLRRSENEWPLARTLYTKYFLTPAGALTTHPPETQLCKASYRALGNIEEPHTISFQTDQLSSELEITGHIVAHLHVSMTADVGGPVPSDIDLFLTLRHYGADRNEVFYTGTTGEPVPLCKGWQRVSLRKVNREHPRHREYMPHRDFVSQDVLPVIPGEVYAVDVEIWPTTVTFQKGESLALEVSSGDTQGVGLFGHLSEERSYSRFGGLNHVHFGPKYLNWVLLPIIPTV